MAVQSTGALSVANDVCAQFNIPKLNVNFTALYAGGLANVSTSCVKVPTSGTISLSQFYGAAGSVPTPVGGMGSVALSSNAATVVLSTLFADVYNARGALTYSLTANPYNSASISTNTLTVTGNNRGTSYLVTVVATSYNVPSLSASLLVSESSPWSPMMAPFTFTNMGATGASGPTAITYGTCNLGYGTAAATTVSAGIQAWTVPSSGKYTFTVAGAGLAGTYGAIGTCTLPLVAGHVVSVLVGQSGVAASGQWWGGSGGSFVYNATTTTLLLTAGGSGGRGIDLVGDNGQLGSNGSAGNAPSGGAAGTGGLGGGANTAGYGGQGGAGYSGDGLINTANGNASVSAKSFLNGGVGGRGGVGDGGFGGGGSGGNGGAGNGGGGGYSGGGGGANNGSGAGGGGGGSYACTGWTTITAGNAAVGYVTVQPAPSPTFTFATMSATGAGGPSTVTYGANVPGPITLSNGMQLWTVPTTCGYRFTVAGSGSYGTYGAVGTCTLPLVAGQVIRLLVGQCGTQSGHRWGGNGGTFVYNASTSALLLTAGGSGGVGIDSIGDNGQLGSSGSAGKPNSLGYFSGAGGTGGLGGGANTQGFGGQGGAGYSGDGLVTTANGNTSVSAKAFLNGGAGGTGSGGYGGFGGGGDSGNTGGAGNGGGGGYSGGGGGGNNSIGLGGGGGGSYTCTSWASISATNSGMGYVNVSVPTRYPPVLITATPSTVSGQPAGNGVYTVTVSSGTATTGGIGPMKPFDADNGTYWIAGGFVNQWFQLQVPSPITLLSYTVGAVDRTYSADSWTLSGSVDGSNNTWVVLDARAAGSGSNMVAMTDTVFAVNQSQSQAAYSYYRMTALSSVGNSSWALGSFFLHGVPCETTWTLPARPMFSLVATSLPAAAGPNTPVLAWGPLVTTAQAAPTLVQTDTFRYVSFGPTQNFPNQTIATSINADVGTTGGFTVVMLANLVLVPSVSDVIVITGGQTNTRTFEFFAGPGGVILPRVFYTGATTGGSAVTLNAWGLYCMTISNTGFVVYVNNVSVYTGTNAVLQDSTWSTIHMNSSTPGTFKMHGCAFYDRVLTSTELNSLYASTKAVVGTSA